MKKYAFLLTALAAVACNWFSEAENSGANAKAEIAEPSDTTGALSVARAREHLGEKKQWVKGYIVGGNLSSSATGIRFEPPFTSDTNLAIADTVTVVLKSSCLSVQLPSGELRETANLVDHPQLLGTRVYILGDIVEAYYGIPGLKNVTKILPNCQ
ncbi:MAG: hypothetical protein J6Y32_05795 [Bacteroidales bacterium]|nr:hypothetical protein [Bacteroidales bacterium]